MSAKSVIVAFAICAALCLPALYLMGPTETQEQIAYEVGIEAGEDISVLVDEAASLTSTLTLNESDATPYSVVWDFGDGQATQTETGRSTVSHSWSDPGIYTLEAIATAPDGNAVARDNTTVTVNTPPAISITKTKISGPDTVSLYEPANWALLIHVENSGGSSANNVVVYDIVPGEWDINWTSTDTGTVTTEQNGGSWHLSWTIGELMPATAAEMTLHLMSGTNGAGKVEPTTAGIYALNEGAWTEYTDPYLETGNVVTDPTSPIYVEAVERPMAELAIHKTFNGSVTTPVRTPWSGNMTVTVSHDGNVASSPVFETVVTDTIPAEITASDFVPSAGTYSIVEGTLYWYPGTLYPGDTVTLTFNVSATWLAPGTYIINPGASVSGHDLAGDPVSAGPTTPINLIATETPAALDIDKALIAGETSIGTNALHTWTFEVTVSNPTGVSGATAYNVTLHDILPNGLLCNHWSTTKGELTVVDVSLTWTIGTLAGGESATLVFDAYTTGWAIVNTYVIQPGAWCEATDPAGTYLFAGPTDVISVLVVGSCGPDPPPGGGDAVLDLAVKALNHSSINQFANLLPGETEPSPIELELFPELFANKDVVVTSIGPAGEEILLPIFIFYVYNTHLDLSLTLTVIEQEVVNGSSNELLHLEAIYLNNNTAYPLWYPNGPGDQASFFVPKGNPSRVLVVAHANIWAAPGQVAELHLTLLESVAPVEVPAWSANTFVRPTGWEDLYPTTDPAEFRKPVTITPLEAGGDSLASGPDTCKQSIIDVPKLSHLNTYIDGGTGILTDITATSAVEWTVPLFDAWWGSEGPAVWWLRLDSMLLYHCQIHWAVIELSVNGITTTHTLTNLGQEIAVELQGETRVKVALRFCIWGYQDGAWAGIGLVDGWRPLAGSTGTALSISPGACLPCDFVKELIIVPLLAEFNLVPGTADPDLPPPTYNNISDNGNIYATYENVRNAENYTLKMFRPWASSTSTVTIWVASLTSGSSQFLDFHIRIVRNGITLDSLSLDQIIAGDYTMSYVTSPDLDTATVFIDFSVFSWDDTTPAKLVLGEDFGPPPASTGAETYTAPQY